jgi:hypothetical protein
MPFIEGLITQGPLRRALSASLWALCALACQPVAQEPPAELDQGLEQGLDQGLEQGLDQGPNDCRDPDSAGATARCLSPTQPEALYVSEALKYFDTLDTSAPEDSVPDYAPLVARWEWPPWLLLTAYGAEDMIRTGVALRALDPSTVPIRDCRFFNEQPFARCYISFEYEEGLCPIYEEFTFNEAGQTTFIEAWSDLPGLRPEGLEDDPWGEGVGFPRLSTRVPGLGSPSGSAPVDSEWMLRAAEVDPQLADYVERARDWRRAWTREIGAADPQFFHIGCGWMIE